MQGSERLHDWGAWCTFLQILFAPKTYSQYALFLREQGFEDFLVDSPLTMRHRIGTFHLSCGEYAVLPLDWIAILGIKFGGHQIPTEEMSFDIACDLLGIPLPLTVKMMGYFGPIALP